MAENPSTRGLINDDNSCYANSLLQMLARIPDVKTWTREYRHVGNGNPNDCIKCILRETLLEMWKPPWTISFIPKKLLKWIRGKDRRFEKGIQADPHELLAFLMEQIQLDIFKHKELEKVSCNIAEHKTQEAVEVIPPGPRIQCNLGVSKIHGLTDRDLLRNYNFTTTDQGCSICPGKKCIERIIAAPPNVLLVKMDRYTMQTNGWFKNDSNCAVSSELELSLDEFEIVKYKLLGVIEHQGSTPTSGHYVSKVENNRQWFSYSDDVVMRKEISKEKTYMIFYSKMDSAEESQPEMEQEDTIVFDENEAITMQNEFLGENHEVNEWRETYSTRIHTEWLTKCRLLVFCLPKTCETDSFKEQYEKCLSAKQQMLYTVTWSTSNFLLQLRMDPTIKSEYDVYCQRIAPLFGTHDVHGWLAEALVIYILDNRINRLNPFIQFICSLNSKGLTTRAITRNWKKVKPNVSKSLRNLLRGKSLFCLDSCTESCNAEKDHYHQSLACMCKMLPPEDTSELSSLSSWYVNESLKDLVDHPLEELLKPAVFKTNEDLEPQVVKFFEEIKIPTLEPHNVYMLMVVNSADPHTAEDLFTMWTENTANFGLYVGMTKHGRYRKEHLIPEEQGGASSVSKFLNDTSVVYLVTSKEYKSYNEAALGEAKLIAVFRDKLEESKKTGIRLKYTILNKILPAVPLFEANAEDREEFDNFIALGYLPFRFLNEPYQEIGDVDSIFQRYLVSEVILNSEDMYGSYHLSEEDVLKCQSCEMTFLTESEKISHMNLHPDSNKYTCPICRTCFIRKWALAQHLRTSNCTVQYVCETCDEVFSDKNLLLQHKKNIHLEKKFVCEICNRNFNDKRSLIHHKRSHTGETVFVCEVCKKEFMNSVALNHHTKSFHKNKANFICEFCNRRFRDSNALLLHKMARNCMKTEVCNECDKRFPNKIDLWNHMKMHEEQKNYACPVCSKRFKQKELMKIHVRSHTRDKYFKCIICEKAFIDNTKLLKHLETHNDEKPFICPFCKKGFKHNESLKDHIMAHTKDSSFYCKKCESEFVLYSELWRHMVVHDFEENCNCLVCGKSFKQKKDLKEHLKEHKAEECFTCKICQKNYVHFSGLLKHMEVHNSEDECICPICDKRFEQKDILMAHVKVHQSEKLLSCKICKKLFAHSSGLSRHMSTHSSGNKYICGLCNKSFKRSDGLKRHIKTHTHENLIDCNVCGQKFTDYSLILKHMEIHNAEKTYTCPFCCEDFKQKDLLKQHLTAHARDKTLNCGICKKAFITDYRLKRHMRSHTTGKTHICPICQKGFNRKDYMQRHLNVHTREKLYVCKICGKEFVHSSGLWNHMKTHLCDEDCICPVCGKVFNRQDSLRNHIKTHTRIKRSNR